MRKKYFVNTYGCQMNVHESEKIAGILKARGLCSAEKIEDADVIVYNSCCIRATAEQRIYGHLSKVKKLKESRPDLIAVLCGCMPQKPDALRPLKKRFPYIDVIIGTHNLNLLGEYLDKIEDEREGGVGHYEIWESERAVCEVPVLRNNSLSAFVNIIEGCDNFCSYCIVPYVKGRERSRPAAAILDEVRGLIGRGFKEITLLGQNVNSYRDGGTSFADLLRRLNGLGGGDFGDGGGGSGGLNESGTNGRFKLKFMTSHPKDLSEEVIKVIAEGDNLAKCIHLPVQSGSSRILRLMNRPYTREYYIDLIKLIRKYMPSAGLSSDLMVGFPSESEEDFLDSLRLVEEVRFNNLYTFIYNRRSGTKADLMEGQVDEKVKIERIEKMIKVQFAIGAEDAGKCVGQVFEVLCERAEKGFIYGKSWEDRPVYFKGRKELIGKFVKVRVASSKNTKLFGEILD
ncbi:MAG: tRNA (N6-isopentenyl adenosine(37)-C2)-methylthiotransferase MiaB [Firmicutes bacterium]|nr:tRNA (N6-isopentenyl adenosine(37)-C2)-methylthiotransferase MiaB [Bacillota bacterium]